MKGDAEWDAINRKIRGTEVGWENTTVVPLIATILLIKDDPLCADVRSHMMDLSSQIPSASPPSTDAVASGQVDEASCGQLVIGTLDLNIGTTLPAEELTGSRPEV